MAHQQCTFKWIQRGHWNICGCRDIVIPAWEAIKLTKMSQNVTFLLQQVDHRQNTPINRPTAIVLQKPACKSRRGHLGACFNPLGSVPTAIYPLCCSAAARLHFLFPARSLAKFCYIDRFVSARAKCWIDRFRRRLLKTRRKEMAKDWIYQLIT